MHIVGRIAELVTGKSWAILFKERIADPCAMQVSSYGDTDNAYIAGGLQTVPADYLNFLQMILDYGVFGQKRVLSEEAIEVFFTPQTRKAQRVESPLSYPATLPSLRCQTGVLWLWQLAGCGESGYRRNRKNQPAGGFWHLSMGRS